MKRALIALCLAGVAFGVASAAAQTAPPVSAQPTLMMVHVRVADMARSERFYNDVFGMSVTNAFSEREHILRFPGSSPTSPGVILLLAREGAPANGGFLLQVPDIESTFARVVAAGGAIERAPRDTSPGIRAGVMTDPDGAHIEVMQFASR